MNNFESERISFEKISLERVVEEEKELKMGCWQEAFDGDGC
ncbi:Uncharacterised protein [[Clostridium] sordellii]|nr:Uncharacterised protein [[Clostridium] sordellii] [Paeniclostridium sordellii]